MIITTNIERTQDERIGDLIIHDGIQAVLRGLGELAKQNETTNTDKKVYVVSGVGGTETVYKLDKKQS